jgi:branched-chain amino acid transport system substrate-binding protein
MARTKTQDLVERDKVQVLVGPLTSTEALAIDDYVRDVKVPLISSSNLAEDMTQRHPNPWMVRATGSTGQVVHPLGMYAATTLHYKRIATVASDFAFGQEAVAGFQRVFEDNGGQVVQKLWVPTAAADFSAYIAQIRKDVDAVFISFSGASSVAFVRQYNEYGLKGKVPLLAMHSVVDEGLLGGIGDDGIGIISGGIYSAAIDTPTNKNYVASYRKEFGVDPGFYATGGYVAGLFLEGALKSTNASVDDKEAFLKALRSTKLADSPRGPLTLDAYGNPVCNGYVRKTERKDGHMQNTVVKVFPDESQFWTYGPKQFLANPVYSRDFPPSRYLEN